MTLRDIENDALEALGFDASSADAAKVRVRVRRQINWAHRQLLATPGLLRLLRDSVGAFAFPSVAGVGRYGLPAALGRINAIYDPATEIALAQTTIDYIRDADPQLTHVGPPGLYAPLGAFPVRTHPSATTPKLTVASTNAADTTQLVAIEYLTGAGDRATATATLAGLTAVELGTTLATNEITRYTLAAPTAGSVTLTSGTAPAAVALATIPAGSTSVRYHHVQLWPTPAGALTYRVDFTREIGDLVDPTETPLVPPDFHELLSVGAQLREYRKADDARAGMLQGEWDAGIVRLKWWVLNPAQTAQGEFATRSRLGSSFPAGT